MLRETVRARSLRNVRQATAAALTSHLKKAEEEKNNGRVNGKINGETADGVTKTSRNGIAPHGKNGVAKSGVNQDISDK